jgi:hypothetical protein
MDADFFLETKISLENEQTFSGLIYAHQLSITIGQAVRDLELIAKNGELADMQNRMEFIPLRN